MGVNLRNSFIERWCLNPFYDVTITVLGVMTGLVGSLFSAEIKSPFSGWGAFSYPALAFWGLLILFSFLFFFKHKATHIAQGKLIRQTESLEVLIKTLPPDGFLTDFARIYNLSHQAALKPFSTQSSNDGKSIIENIEHAIRTILDGIVTLTKTFDSKPHDVIYAANIMLYKSITDLSDAEIKEISKNVMFVEEGFDLKTLEGLLGLQVNLSTTTETDKPEPDAELREFYLPIPINKKSDDGKRYKYLPGAPLAFIENTMNVNSDSSSLCRWCQDSGDFSPTLCKNVEDYFLSEASEKIKSFASLPISMGNHSLRLGVLNIHRNSKGLLDEKEPLKQFWPLMQPFLALLFDLLLERQKQSRKVI